LARNFGVSNIVIIYQIYTKIEKNRFHFTDIEKKEWTDDLYKQLCQYSNRNENDAIIIAIDKEKNQLIYTSKYPGAINVVYAVLMAQEELYKNAFTQNLPKYETIKQSTN
jgi:hypothetical protein